MSGFLPDLASWALGGGAGNQSTTPTANNSGGGGGGGGEPPLTEHEVRARRLARMEALSATNNNTSNNNTSNNTSNSADEPQAMQVDDISPTAASSTPQSMDISPPRKNRTITSQTTQPQSLLLQNPNPNHEQSSFSSSSVTNQQTKKKAKETHHTPTTPSSDTAISFSSDPGSRLQRKKEALIKKLLQITLSNGINAGAAPNRDPACVMMDLDDPIPLGVHSIAELLATRLALPMANLQTIPPQKPLLNYLAAAHRMATEELRTLRATTTSKKLKEHDEELVTLVTEIQHQVVSYASSSLIDPDLFDQAHDGTEQLTKALLTSGLDPSQDITFGAAGPSSSFYHALCDELQSQDETSFARVLYSVVVSLMLTLKTCDSLDSGVGDTSALGIVSALTNICAHKKAALLVSKLDSFLLPTAGTQQASETIHPPFVMAGADIMRMFSAENRPYQKRSGPGIEKETLLGLVMRISTPKSNPAFAPTNILRQKLDTVERTTSQQRQQLHIYQEACHQLIMNLIKGGTEAREQVLQWFVDCQILNTGATAMRPDITKVSSPGLLLNVSVELLKLCDPFMADDAKHKLIDPGFVSLSQVGKLIFPTTGDSAIARLGESSSDEDSPMDSVEYAPKNTFVPQVFFMAARSLALGIVPQLSSHENLLRLISHQHWELNSQNRDVYSDPHFSMLISRQRSAEVALFQEDMTTDTIRFINLMAKLLVGLTDDILKKMPEHFVNNICDVLMSFAKLKPRSLRGMDARFAFSLMVKLLSPKYKSVRCLNSSLPVGPVYCFCRQRSDTLRIAWFGTDGTKLQPSGHAGRRTL
jgi:ribosomal 50S subunit-associated protein YjgA (DUF615 family)